MTSGRAAYHFTHLDNLANILEDGAILCDREVQIRKRLALETADADMKEWRRSKRVPIPPGGTLADYTPFYFASRSPMLLRVCTGDRVVNSSSQDQLVFFVIDPHAIIAAGLAAVVTDGHPRAGFTEFHVAESMESAVDWQVMEGPYWADTDIDGDRQRRRQAEFLVHGSLPLSVLTGIVCRTQATMDIVQAALSAAGIECFVDVRPDCYYLYKP
jgi:hypothetical protein